MELKELIGEELAGQVAAKAGDRQVLVFDKGVKVVIDDGKLIPKYRLDEVIAARDAATALVEQHEKDLKILKKAAEGNTALTQQITELQAVVKASKDEAERTMAQVRKQFALKEALMGAGVVDPDARDLLALKFDVSKIEVGEDGKVKGFDDMLKPIKENKTLASMFGQTVIGGQQHGDGGTPDPSLGEYATKNPFSEKTLNLMEQIKLQRDNPKLAERLRAMAGTTT